MAYACARAGWTFVADDATFLLRKRADRYAIGNPHTIRFRESARRLFPELSHYTCGTRPNGKFGIEAFTRHLPITTSPGCSIEHVVFLNRNGSSVAQLRPCRQVRAIDWCSRFAEWGDDGARSHQAEAYRRLAECSVWEMEYRDLESGVARLEQLIWPAGDTGKMIPPISSNPRLPAHARVALELLSFSPRQDGAAAELPRCDWRSMLQFCDRTQLTLSVGLRGHTRLPPSVLDRTERNLAQNTGRWERIKQVHLRLSAALESAGLEFLCLKGIQPLPFVYQKPAFPRSV